MTYSMTAFARVQKQQNDCIFCWELKSVNHRYLDISFRLPEAFRFIENNLRQLLRGKINRGKLECQLKVVDLSENKQSILINEGLLKSLLNTSEALSLAHQIANDITVSHVLSWPGIVQVEAVDRENLASSIAQSFAEALDELILIRHAEGRKLNELVTMRLGSLQDEIDDAREQVAWNSQHSKEKLLHRLRALQMEVAESRVEQEMALMLARLDVSEELDRLQTHVQEVSRTLTEDEVAGRRLDFLMQELNREANTLSSKSDSVTLTQQAVQMKVLIEQMREQIQNIE